MTRISTRTHDDAQDLLDFLEGEIDAKGLDALMPGAFMAKYARPRRFEVCPCVLFTSTSTIDRANPLTHGKTSVSLSGVKHKTCVCVCNFFMVSIDRAITG